MKKRETSRSSSRKPSRASLVCKTHNVMIERKDCCCRYLLSTRKQQRCSYIRMHGNQAWCFCISSGIEDIAKSRRNRRCQEPGSQPGDPRGVSLTASQSRLPGTRTKRTHSAASTSTVTASTMMARLARSFRTYGSRTREKLKGVYSLNPARARMGSSEY